MLLPPPFANKWPPQPPSWHKSFREKDEQGSALLDLPPVEDKVDVVLRARRLDDEISAGHHPGDATSLGEITPPRTGSSSDWSMVGDCYGRLCRVAGGTSSGRWRWEGIT